MRSNPSSQVESGSTVATEEYSQSVPVKKELIDSESIVN